MSDLGLLPPTAEQFDEPQEETGNRISMTRARFGGLLAGVAVLSAALTFVLLLVSGADTRLTTNNSTNKVNGEVALTQEQLFTLIKEQGVTAYWTGPVAGAKYALTITADKQVYIKYLPNGQGLGDTTPKYRVIATYPEPGAYDITRAAGTQSNSVAFINSDGGAVYYSKDKATNVYVAYSGQPYEVEIFDPDATKALDMATQSGVVVQVK